jgi:hypothetical protein
MNTDRNKYEAAARVLLCETGVVVGKVRTSSSGVAMHDGTIEAPRPRGPISFGIFAHEVGHVVLHKDNGRYPRWREEVEAWEYALNQVERFGLNGYDRVYTRATRSIGRAFRKAMRAGVAPTTIQDSLPTWWKDTGWEAVIDRGWVQ